MSRYTESFRNKLAIAVNYFKTCEETTCGRAVKCLIKFRAIRHGTCAYKSPLFLSCFPLCVSLRRLEAINEARKKAAGESLLGKEK